MVLLATVVVAVTLSSNRPDLKKDLTNEQLNKMLSNYGAKGYLIVDCGWKDSCYFCDYTIGTLKLKDRMITCNFDDDKKIYGLECKNVTYRDLEDENGKLYDETREECETVQLADLSMEELVVIDVTQLIRKRTLDKIERDDDQDLEGKNNTWSVGK